MKGILVSYDFCTGCHSCEVACKKELGLGKEEYGIKINELGPHKYENGKKTGTWEWTFAPMLTKACDLCASRTEQGKMPMCVQHCQAWCMAYGELDELVKKLDGKSRYAFLTPLES